MGKRFKKCLKEKGVSTELVHSGEEREKFADSITTPIVQSSTYVFKDTEEIIAYKSGKIERIEYGRYGNPTQRAVEMKLSEVECAEDCILFPSGMSAITTAFLALMSKGDHMVVLDECYKKTRQFCDIAHGKFGIDCTFIDSDDYKGLENAVRKNTKLIFAESVTNPHMNVIDIKKLSYIASSRNVKLIIDNTFATPYNERPIEFGADLVAHSATKYLGGHNDILAGAVAGSKDLITQMRDFQGIIGGVIDPHCAYLLLRGLKTLAVRVARHNATAIEIAHYLEGHPRIKKVYYPGLKSHNHHKLALKYLKGFGGVVSFEIDGGIEETRRFLDNLSLIYLAPSLGGAESMAYHPALLTFQDMTAEERVRLDIKDELVRLSVGLEDADDLISDLEQALESM